jgi:hypothetical protein
MSPVAAARVMRLVAIGFFPTALILVSSAFAPIDGISVLLHDFLDFPLDGDFTFTAESRWIAAIAGGVFAALCVLLHQVVAPAIEEGDERVRRGTILALLVWFPLDSIGSIAAGAPANAAFNVLFLALFLTPLIAVRRESAVRV